MESIYIAGVELDGTDIAEQAKSIERSNKMLKLVDHSVNLLREKHKNGEEYYWINQGEFTDLLVCQLDRLYKPVYDFDRFVEIIEALQEKVTVHVSEDDKTIAKRPT